MAIPSIKTAFSGGEFSPSLYGRVDFAKWHSGCSVARNFLVNYKGGLLSRAGTALVGVCKQAASASSVPPRNIPFKFNMFQSYTLEFGDQYMRVLANGAYVTETPINITAATRTDPCQITVPGIGLLANPWQNGDTVFVIGVTGMTQINGQSFTIGNVNLAAGTCTLMDIFGDPVNAINFGIYIAGGTAARIFTLITPYAAADLPYLKFSQSADVLSLTCVNQITQTEYVEQELTRLSAANWTIAPPTIASSIVAPVGAAAVGTAWSTGPGPAAYGYVVTAVDNLTGQESIASNIGVATNSVDIAGQFGTVKVTWTAVAGAGSYNIYRAAPDYTNTGNFVGQLFGFVGQSRTNSWMDTNIIADFNTTPPLHQDPFSGAGNRPGVVSYFQQRRSYGYSINSPDTYNLSQPGAYTNFDSADPPIDSDAIVGTPWATQVNGIQWMLPMPGGLIVGTGEGAWQVSGTGGVGSPITPSQQSAQPQEQIGFSATVPPIKVNYSILYVPGKASAIREIQYNFYFNIYGGADRSVLSSHLFVNRTIKEWGWALEPYKVIWAVATDGKLLSFTYLPEEEVRALTRHDTNGLFQSVSVASEPPVDAPYFIVKRYIVGKKKWLYLQERMDNRLWQNVEQSWCLDSALSLPQPTPNATISPAATNGIGGVTLNYIVDGGTNYTAPGGNITGDGSGAQVLGFTVVGGVITDVQIAPGAGYTQAQLVITDATGSNAVVALNISNDVHFATDQPVFAAGDVGKVLRVGGGIATVTGFVSAQEIIASVPLATKITATMPDDPNNMPLPQVAGSWSLTTPVSVVGGLNHLEGMAVEALADGAVVDSLTVTNGQVTLPAPASQILVGLPFLPQAQSLHADLPGANIQGKRKRVQGVTVRVANTRGLKIGQDQPIAAVQPNQAEIPWGQMPNYMTEIEDRTNLASAGNALPLFTGDKYVVIAGDYSTTDNQASPGMVAVQQDYPLPAEILAFVPMLELGDIPDA